MNQDLLERQLSDSLGRRASGANPRASAFAEVERRAVRHRRRRASVVGVVGAVSTAILVVCVLTVAGTRSGDDQRLTVGPADDPTTTMTAPTGLVGDRWAVLSSVEPTRSDVAVTTTNGLQTSVAGMQDIEVTPYVYVGPRSADRAVVYGLSGERWTTTVSWTELPADASATTTMLVGSNFDPSRFTEIQNTSGQYVGDGPPPDVTVQNPSIETPRPEDLMAAPDSHQVVMPVEHLGLFDWVVLPEGCVPVGDFCTKTAVGGDGERLIIVELNVPRGFDLRSALTDVGLRSIDELALPPGQYPPAPPGATVMPYQAPAAWGAAPFFTVFLPITRDDSVWPAEVPTDYCTAYRTWKQTQIDHLGAFGTPGWIHWAEALGAMASPEVADAWSTLVAEQSAGHDTSASEPGVGALNTVVTDGDARCPA